MCFGGGGTETRYVTQQSSTNLPAYVTQGGEQTFKQAQELGQRDYPQYTDARLAGFQPDTTSAFQMVRDASGTWQPLLDKATGAVDKAMVPVGQAQIDQYMNPYTQSVIDATLGDINNQYARDRIARNDAMSKSGSYLNEANRYAIDTAAQDARDRTLGLMSAQLRSQGFQNALNQANTERGAQLQGASAYSGLGATGQQLRSGDINALLGIGTQQQQQQQNQLSLNYQDFLNQFYYPQEQLNYVQSVLSGVPYNSGQTTTSQQQVPTTNLFAQNLGAFGALAGGLGSMGLTF